MKKLLGRGLSVLRGRVQLVSLVLLNSYFLRAYTGGVCAPALNCWACPSAIASCPIGALQYAAGRAPSAFKAGAPLAAVPVYVIGSLVAMSVLLGDRG